MTKTEDRVRKSGLAFHVHHDKLIEMCWDYDKRVAYIKKEKPPEEIELRLRLFKLITKDKLPLILISRSEVTAKMREANIKWRKSYIEWKEIYAEGKKVDAERRTAYPTATEWMTAYTAWMTAYTAWRTAYTEWEKSSMLAALHAELCPNCPWDGKTIFPKTEVMK